MFIDRFDNRVGRSARMALLLTCLLLTTPAAAGDRDALAPRRWVEGRTLKSAALPAITVRLSPEFEYAGRFDFRIRDVAEGERFVFVDARDRRIRRLFVFQFEGFLPGNDHTYNYDFTRARVLKGHRFRHNTWAYSNSQAASENPGGEGVLMAAFLRERGYVLEDELMMSRFVTVPDRERRHELILFYLENASTTGLPISRFYEGESETEEWKRISGGLTRRSLASFEILDPPDGEPPGRDGEGPRD